jgi:hypothetical protein
MKKLKVNLDRPDLESKHIASKQNFDQVLRGFRQLKPPIWKNPWFYGPVGLASIALVLSIGIINAQNETNENKTTSSELTDLPPDTKCILPPLVGVDKQFTVFEIDASKEQTLKLPSGTEIHIPKESLRPSSLDQSVEIKIREFHSKSEAFVAGIPMNYEGDKTFESAGMIEIRAVQKNSNVPIVVNKPVEISMVLGKNPKNFSFWNLDEESNKWVDYPAVFSAQKREVTVDNTLKKNSIEREIHTIESQISVNELATSKNNPPKREIFHLPIEQNQRFDLDFNIHEFPELAQFSGMEFEVVASKPYDKSFTKKTWSDVELTKENETYYATFTSKKESFKTEIRPVLTGQKLEKAEEVFSQSMDRYHQIKEKLEEEKKTLFVRKKEQQEKYDRLIASFNFEDTKKQQQSLVINSNIDNAKEVLSEATNFRADFSIRSFGVFNCDKPVLYPEPLSHAFVFSFGGDPIEVLSAHIFDEKKDTRFSFGLGSSHSLREFGFFEKNENTLVVIDRKGKMGFIKSLDNQDFNHGVLKLTLVDKQNVNVDFIQNLINEKTVSS